MNRLFPVSLAVLGLAVLSLAVAHVQSRPPALSEKPQAFGDLRMIRSNSLNDSKLLDDLADRSHLWGIGMPTGLDRELAIFDGVAETGTFRSGSAHQVDTPTNPDITFLAYARVESWRTIDLPDTVKTFQDLDTFISSQISSEIPESMVRLEADTESLKWFVVGGMGDLSPDPLRSFLAARKLGTLHGQRIEAVGLYTRKRQGVLTSPGRSLHLHFRTIGGKDFVGHLDDEVQLKPGGRVLLPSNH